MNSPSAWARRLGRAAPELAWLSTEAPGAVRRFMGELESGSLKVDLQPRGFEPSLRRLERIGNRLVLGMIVAALIVGPGVSTSAYHPAAWSSALGTVVTVGFVLAAVLGVALAWSVFRSSRLSRVNASPGLRTRTSTSGAISAACLRNCSGAAPCSG
jgi:ubiquinone biosynthesis protein